MPLPVLAHVDADHGPGVVEQELGQGPGQLGLAHPGRAQEEERADGAVGVGQPGPAATDGVGHRRHRLVLAHHPGMEGVLHADELLDLPLEQAADRDARGPADHFGHVLGVDLLFEEALGLLQLVERVGGRLDLALEGRDAAVGDLRGLARLPSRLEPLGLAAQLLELALRATGWCRWPPSPTASGPSWPPTARGRLASSSSRRASRSADAVSVSLARAIRSISSWRIRRVDHVELGGHGVDLDAQAAGRLVHEVDGLVGQEPAGHVAVGEDGGGHQCGILDADAVVDLVPLLQAAQDGDGVLDRREAARTPAGSGARGRRPSRCTGGTRRGWWPRSVAARPGPASA